MTFSPARIVVTGASSGIGRACVAALARPGRTIAVGYRSDPAGADRTVAEAEHAGARATAFPIDLADAEHTLEAFAVVVETLGGIDVLVNNAGVNRRCPATDENLDDLSTVMTVNALTPIVLSGYAARCMTQQGTGGRIINVTSVHEHIPISGGTAYCAAKAALGMATKAMALELGPEGVTVNSVAPGETATPMNGVPDGITAHQISRPAIPARRPGDPGEIASLVAFLADQNAAYLTGESLVVDGGLALTAAEPNAQFARTY